MNFGEMEISGIR